MGSLLHKIAGKFMKAEGKATKDPIRKTEGRAVEAYAKVEGKAKKASRTVKRKARTASRKVKSATRRSRSSR